MNDYGATVRIDAPLGQTTNVCLGIGSAGSKFRRGNTTASWIRCALAFHYRFGGPDDKVQVRCAGNTIEETIDFSGISAPHIDANGSITTKYTYDPIFSKVTSKTDDNGHKSY